MKIACVILGTRGDVQPMVALSTGFIKNGHNVIICAPPENEELAIQNNCQFIAFGPSPQKAVKEDGHKMKGGVTAKISPSEMKKLIGDQIKLLPGLISDVDLVLGAGVVIGAHTAADVLKIPYRLVIFYPMLLGTSNNDPVLNRMIFGFGRTMFNLLMKGFINKKRLEFDLPPIKDIWEHWMGENVIVACDKEINEVNKGVAFTYTQTGYMQIPSKDSLPDNVEAFLNAGKTPV